MANTFSPFGFRSFGHQDGSAPTMGLQKFTINSSYATAIYTGDPVGLSTASGFEGTIAIGATANGTDKNLGVFAGCEYYNSNVQRVVWSPYFPASVGSSSPCNAYVITDPEMTFLVQASTTSVVGSTLIGQNVSWAAGTGNTTNGQSGAYVLSSAAGATSSYQWRIVNTYSAFGPPGVNGTSTTEGGGYLIVQPNGNFRNTLFVTGQST
jgi:hypothetical protein